MATTRIYDGTGVIGSPVSKTQAAMTLYVRSTGNDSNLGTSDSPLLTLAEAFRRVPDIMAYAVTIDVGSGSFAGATLNSKFVHADGIKIQGTMVTSTLATGPNTGTSTGGSTTTLVLTSAGWTVDDLKGRYVYVNSGHFLIKSNTSDTITIAGSGSTMSGQVFTIRDIDTTFTGSIAFNSCTSGYISICQIKSNYAGYLVNANNSKSSMTVYTCSVVGVNGYLMYSFRPETISVSNCYVSSAYGLFYGGASNSVTVDACIISGGYAGVYASLCGTVNVGYLTCSGVTSNGSVISYLSRYLWVSNSSISNTVSGSGVYPWFSTDNNFTNVSGTGNARFGINLDKDCFVSLGSLPTITGSLGDYSFNNSNARTWATDYSSVGDTTVCQDTRSTVTRTA